MSLSIGTNGLAVHYPRKPSVFEFDDEVAQCFEDMALRSIPMYREVHRLHAALAQRYIRRMRSSVKKGEIPKMVLVDIGASRGGFIKAFCNQFQIDPNKGHPNLIAIAVDPSRHMLDELEVDLPFVYTVKGEVGAHGCPELDSVLKEFGGKADILNASYVVQFMQPIDRSRAFDYFYNILRDFGLLFLAQKDVLDRTSAMISEFIEEYIDFRKEQGYSESEIEAKSRALRNAMWPETYERQRMRLMVNGFSDVVETTRWLNFSSCVAVR